MKLIDKRQLTKDTYSFIFERPSKFTFLPGQYLKIFLNIKNPDSRGVSRYFTISSSPTEKNLAITTRIIKSSFKQKLGSLLLGSVVEMRGPWGNFILDEKDKRPRVYLAGGIGITTARSMAVYIRDKNLDIPFTLLASFSKKDRVIFYDELTAFKNKKIKTIFKMTSETGRINENTIKETVEDTGNSVYYISGPISFVEAMEKIIKGLGVAEKNIKTEDFPGY